MKAFEIEFSDEALLKRPEHAATLGRIFTTWSLIEAAVASILGHLMHNNHRAAIALLSQFKTNNARLEAVKKVAAELVDEADRAAFSDLMGRVKTHAKIRNDIAHGVWGIKQDEPNLLFRLPLQAYSNLVLEIVPEAKAGKSPLAPVVRLMEKVEEFTLVRLLEIELVGRNLLHSLWDDLNARTKAVAES